MKHRLTSISILQTSKIAAILYAVFGLCLVPFGCFFAFMGPDDPINLAMAAFYFLSPLIYMIVGFLFVAAAAWAYNQAAKYVGGIEFELETYDPTSSETLAQGD